MKILLGYIFTYTYILSLLFLTGILRKKGKCSRETCRKIIHIFVSLVWFIAIYFFGHTYHMVIPPITFVILNYISYKKNLFKMMECSDIENGSPGTVYYPISILILSILTVIDNRFVASYGIGWFCMALGDGLAPYFGQKYKSYQFRMLSSKKTLAGALIVFICSLIISSIFTICYSLPISIFGLLLISLAASTLELIGTEGIDNLLLPIGIAVISYLLIILQLGGYMEILILISSIMAIVFAYYKKSLTNGGVIVAWVLSVVIIYCIGATGFIILSVVFLTVVGAGKIAHGKKDSVVKSVNQKSGKRDSIQVFANVGIGALSSVLFYITKDDIYFVVYACVMASSLADSMSSEIGVLSKHQPVDICAFKKITKGMSGGVTILGLVSALTGAFAIGFIFYLLTDFELWVVLFITVMGFIGSIIDSILGSALQVKFKCFKCNKMTEKSIHCDKKTKYISGVRYINNDIVNILNNLCVFVIATVILNVI